MTSHEKTTKKLFPSLPPRRKAPTGVNIDPQFNIHRHLPFRLHRIVIRLGFIGSGTSSRSFNLTKNTGVELKVRDWRVITVLAAFGPLTNSEISNISGMKAATVSRSTALLASSGLLISQILPSDNRKVIQSLTSSGASLFNLVNPTRSKLVNEVESCLTEEERNTLYSILDKLESQLSDLKLETEFEEISWG